MVASGQPIRRLPSGFSSLGLLSTTSPRLGIVLFLFLGEKPRPRPTWRGSGPKVGVARRRTGSGFDLARCSPLYNKGINYLCCQHGLPQPCKWQLACELELIVCLLIWICPGIMQVILFPHHPSSPSGKQMFAVSWPGVGDWWLFNYYG